MKKKRGLSMRKLNELLRLKYSKQCSHREIAQSLGISAGTVSETVKRAIENNVSWPLPERLQTDDALYALLYPKRKKSTEALVEPDWSAMTKALRQHKGVTLQLLWHEYKQQHPNGYGYSRYCQLYRKHCASIDVVMRQPHVFGEKCFVDYAGVTVPWTETTTGECRQAQIFVAVLGGSSYTFIEATASQALRDWIGSHCRAFEFFGGVAKVLVPDNLKSGVTKAHRYDPDINPTYQECAEHYQIAVVPARAYRPRDKAKAEVGVQGIERWILAPLRNHQFFSIGEINEAIQPLLEAYNNKAFQKMPGSRALLYQENERATLLPLPEKRYQFAHWHTAKAGIDYHVHVSQDKHYYSIPYQYARKLVDVRITDTLIECFSQHKKIATHRRVGKPGHTTLKEHMPKGHQEYAQWTPQRVANWAKSIGEQTHQLITTVIAQHAIPYQSFRCCQGILSLAKKYSEPRLELAAKRALAIGSYRYQSIASILKNGLENAPLPEITSASNQPLHHDNVRGEDYYQ